MGLGGAPGMVPRMAPSPALWFIHILHGSCSRASAGIGLLLSLSLGSNQMTQNIHLDRCLDVAYVVGSRNFGVHVDSELGTGCQQAYSWPVKESPLWETQHSA